MKGVLVCVYVCVCVCKVFFDNASSASGTGSACSPLLCRSGCAGASERGEVKRGDKYIERSVYCYILKRC